jgi:hypothetical protein
MADINSKVVQKDEAVAIDSGDATASRLAALKPGQSIDIIQRTDPLVQTQTADQLGERPTQSWPLGIGSGGAPGIQDYIVKLQTEPLGVPGFGRTTRGQSTTTSRSDTNAADSSGRVPTGTDESGVMSFGPKPGPATPKPFFDRSSDAGGPRTADGRSMLAKQPSARKKSDGEEGSA